MNSGSRLEIDLIVVDGPNLMNLVFNQLKKIDEDEETLLGYIEKWFDVDRYLRYSIDADRKLHTNLGIVVFHSKKGIGGGKLRLADSALLEFWGRQAAIPETSCIVVDLKGADQDHYEFDCKNCGKKNKAHSTSEKGIDTSITTYLMETVASWDSVCIVSKDIDFVPPVLALRRAGKRVFVVTEEQKPPTALQKASQSNFYLETEFLRKDLALYKFVKPGGVLDRLVTLVEKDSSRKSIQIFEVGPGLTELMTNSEHLLFTIGVYVRYSSDRRVEQVVEDTASMVKEWAFLTDQVEIGAFDKSLGSLFFEMPGIVGQGYQRHMNDLQKPPWCSFLGGVDLVV